MYLMYEEKDARFYRPSITSFAFALSYQAHKTFWIGTSTSTRTWKAAGFMVHFTCLLLATMWNLYLAYEETDARISSKVLSST
jgi:uncharacterized membrane protein YecN with MAPEG domain